MEFGKTLRAAREARGKTIEEVARETRLMSQLIADLENENMSRIAAPIYGRGFVKLYCEAVGLEAKPMIDEFMKVYNGEHEPIIRERETIEESSYTEGSLLGENNEVAGAPSSLFDEPVASISSTDSQPSLSRYSSPLSERPALSSGFAFPTIPPIVWRVGAVAIIAFLIIWILVKAVGALYRFSATDPKAAASGGEEPKIVERQHTAPEEREQVAIPPLYID